MKTGEHFILVLSRTLYIGHITPSSSYEHIILNTILQYFDTNSIYLSRFVVLGYDGIVINFRKKTTTD